MTQLKRFVNKNEHWYPSALSLPNGGCTFRLKDGRGILVQKGLKVKLSDNTVWKYEGGVRSENVYWWVNGWRLLGENDYEH